MSGDPRKDRAPVSFREHASSCWLDHLMAMEFEHVIEVLRPVTPPGFSGGLACDKGKLRWRVVHRITGSFMQQGRGSGRYPGDRLAAEQAQQSAWRAFREWLDAPS